MLKLSNKKLIIFDLDGTLIDSSPDLALAINHTLSTLGRETFSADTIHYWVGNGAVVLVKRALSGSSEIDENIDPELFEKALKIFFYFYSKNLTVETVTYPLVKETLSTLKKQGYTLAIVTNKPFAFVAPILKALELNGFFELILGGDSLEEKKPHPLPLLHVCKTLGFDVAEAVMVGDSKNDILAAKACNMQSIGLTYGYNYGEAISIYNPDAVFDNFSDILKKAKIAIVGGGVAGATTAIYLGKLGLDVTLFEKEKSLVNGPPFCHLHAGGNLYRDISDTQCITLLKQSIDFLKFYPFVVDYRPTVIALPTSDKSDPSALLPRLKRIQKEYAQLIQKDATNEVLGKSYDYFKLYSRAEIEHLKSSETVSEPKTLDEWMTPVAKHIDLSKVQFPLIMVQEYGLNLFRLASSAMLILNEMELVNLHTQTSVTAVEKEGNRWNVSYKRESEVEHEKFDYLINATGFRTGKIDDMLGVPCKRMVEFKAAYVSHWQGSQKTLFPEIIFHGERGTPQGMGQFTPYPDGYFQLHGMTNNITLYKDGLVANSKLSCQPELGQNFIEKIENEWNEEETKERTNAAIRHLAQFIPNFSTATVASKPLFGAQQIPGDDPSLRVAEVSFPAERYARCEIVKVSSVIDMIQTIIEQLIELDYLDASSSILCASSTLEEIDIQKLAMSLAKERAYPTSLAKRNISKI